VFVDMPLESIHKLAFKAAEAAHCAGEQDKYWEMHDRLFENYKTLAPWNPHAEAVGLDVSSFEECLSSGKFEKEIRRDISEARKAGVTGTPAFMLARTDPDSSKVRILAVLKGAKPFAAFKAEIDRLLEQVSKAEAGEPIEGDAAIAGVTGPDAADSPALRPSVTAPSRSAKPVTAKTFESDTIESLQRVLVRAPEGSPAWITAPRSDPGAIARAGDLARIFDSAGWEVEPVSRSAVNVRPGLYLFAGDEQPPAYIETLRLALEEAGLAPSYATGYRDYYADRATKEPGFRGFPFTPGQTFVLVVGRMP
jgi:hypothetical protein